MFSMGKKDDGQGTSAKMMDKEQQSTTTATATSWSHATMTRKTSTLMQQQQ